MDVPITHSVNPTVSTASPARVHLHKSQVWPALATLCHWHSPNNLMLNLVGNVQGRMTPWTGVIQRSPARTAKVKIMAPNVAL